ncbi:MAG: hypothetical protein ACYC2G_07385 [Gemmatimonadaceae bacterium]
MDEGILVPLGFFLMIVVLAIGVPLARAFARNLDRRGDRAVLPPGMDDRLLQMQQSLDAVAVEIERISEAQRFTTRLLAERAPGRREHEPAGAAVRPMSDNELTSAPAEGGSHAH